MQATLSNIVTCLKTEICQVMKPSDLHFQFGEQCHVMFIFQVVRYNYLKIRGAFTIRF